nr:FAD-dependent oxidoreductase [Rhizobium leguminosarum]
MQQTARRYAYSADIPELDDVDVLVIGGGPSGLSAAVAAARLGVRVRLVERYGFLGGNLTAGLVGPCITDPRYLRRIRSADDGARRCAASEYDPGRFGLLRLHRLRPRQGDTFPA